MKKILVFLLLLFIPFIVNAQDVKIKEVTVEDYTKGLEVDENPEFENLKLSFDLKFSEIDEFVKYKVVVENTSNKDYEIDDTTSFSEGEYIKYEFSYDGDKIVKSKGTKEFFITISYNKEVPLTAFEDGKFKEKNAMVINLTNGESSSDQKNPYTATLPYLIAIIAIISLVLLLVFNKKRDMLLLIPFILFIPVVIYALEKISIEIEANIEIEEHCNYKLVTKKGSFSNDEIVQKICVDELYTGYDDENFATLTYFGGARTYNSDVYFSIFLYKYTFNDNSYIKVYSDDTKSNLLLELNKNNTFNNMYGIGGRSYNYNSLKDRVNSSTVSWNLGAVNMDNIYVEVSDDLKTDNNKENRCTVPEKDCRYYQPIEYSLEIDHNKMIVSNYNIKGPFTDDEEVINQINNLSSSIKKDGLIFTGFTNCKIYDKDKERICEGNTYYANYIYLEESKK